MEPSSKLRRLLVQNLLVDTNLHSQIAKLSLKYPPKDTTEQPIHKIKAEKVPAKRLLKQQNEVKNEPEHAYQH